MTSQPFPVAGSLARYELRFQSLFHSGRGLTFPCDHLGQVHAVGRRLAAFFERHDLLLTPVLAAPPAPLGRWAMSNPDFLDYRLGPAGLWRYSPFAPLANATGGASISLPAGTTATGLPIGAMLSGQLGDDVRLLALAAELEAAGAWTMDRPTLTQRQTR